MKIRNFFSILLLGLCSSFTMAQSDLDLFFMGRFITIDDPSPSIRKGTDFGLLGKLVAGGTGTDDLGRTRTFTIRNAGGSVLVLDGTPAVTITGADAGDFSVIRQPGNTSIAAGDSTTFSIRYAPTMYDASNIERTATVSISRAGIPPYTFEVKGRCIELFVSYDFNQEDMNSTDHMLFDWIEYRRSRNGGLGQLTLYAYHPSPTSLPVPPQITVLNDPIYSELVDNADMGFIHSFINSAAANPIHTAMEFISPQFNSATFGSSGENLIIVADLTYAYNLEVSGELPRSSIYERDLRRFLQYFPVSTSPNITPGREAGLRLERIPNIITDDARFGSIITIGNDFSGINGYNNRRALFFYGFGRGGRAPGRTLNSWGGVSDGWETVVMNLGTVSATDNFRVEFRASLGQTSGGLGNLRDIPPGRILGIDNVMIFEASQLPADIVIEGLGGNVISNGEIFRSSRVNYHAANGTDFRFADNAKGRKIRIFTIRNEGAQRLESVMVSITGSSDFTIVSDPSTTVDGLGATTTSFSIQFKPNGSGLGFKNAMVQITSNDPDESPFTFGIRGRSVTAFALHDFDSPGAPANTWTYIDPDTMEMNHANWVRGDASAGVPPPATAPIHVGADGSYWYTEHPPNTTNNNGPGYGARIADVVDRTFTETVGSITVVSPPFDLSSASTTLALVFDVRYGLALRTGRVNRRGLVNPSAALYNTAFVGFSDHFNIDYSLNNGTTWAQLTSAVANNRSIGWSDYIRETPNRNLEPPGNPINGIWVGHGGGNSISTWQGNNGEWTSAEIDLPDNFAGVGRNAVRFRFRLRAIDDQSSIGLLEVEGDRLGAAFDNFAIYTDVVGLPVELLTFSGRKEDDIVVLDWNTSSETNNDFFEVQRSTDGVRFAPIGKVEGHGTVNRIINYSYKDKNPHTGQNFYRLKQVDYDGTEEYHKIIMVNMGDGLRGREMSVKVYPNPSNTNGINIMFTPGDDHSPVSLQLTDPSGRTYLEDMLESTESFNEFFALNYKMAPGIYILTIRQGDQSVKQKVVIK